MFKETKSRLRRIFLKDNISIENDSFSESRIYVMEFVIRLFNLSYIFGNFEIFGQFSWIIIRALPLNVFKKNNSSLHLLLD